MERWEGRQKAPLPLPSAAEWMRGEDEDCGGDRKRGSGCGGMKGCQADKCGADLRDAKPYHRRHKVCEPHAKAAAVLVAGIPQRFCQQCSRFHELSEFDESKRSCRTRLAGHNERRRKNTVEQVGPSSGRREMVCGSGVQMEDLHLPMSMPEKAGYKQHFQIR